MNEIAAEVRMPRLSEAMTEGTIVRWLHSAGAEIAVGDELAEIDTDKAVVGLEAESAGVLEILLAEGESAPVGAVIARVGAGAPPTGSPPATPIAATPAPAAPPRTGFSPSGQPIASPLARRRARELGVDLTSLAGSGPGGRIVRADVEAAAHREKPALPAGDAAERVPLTRIQQATVRRLAQAAAIPAFALTAEAETSELTALRSALAAVADPAPTVTDLVVAAVARALRDFPRLNASADDGAVRQHRRVNVGIATETPEGLVVPVVADTDTLAPATLAGVTKGLIARARAGAATPDDLAGATFTVSNLGMFGVVAFQAVIVPPQAAILAVGAIRVVSGTTVMTLTLTCDHRVVDGAEAARFLTRVVALLEQPIALMVPEPSQGDSRATRP
ncbi:dihydrolipoamide acetyltransferase family protein [Amycolatopsis pithecellobii]|uniref:Dihydrolipoamide acetyltransferase component of pyruvate dehydrogenase complex n=1 Tax=Amycolatopsis pithecellobii TaxID=664692 RepID=A0A6N7YJU2_9PSEU|nr:dihydrolipoamide acetyltransferase family protein [Amycolatopsis pithecellobii]MTD53185.1 hypothetical protein [Amycolatopsis pithecellobii]